MPHAPPCCKSAEANRRYGKDNLSVILCRAGDARPRAG